MLLAQGHLGCVEGVAKGVDCLQVGTEESESLGQRNGVLLAEIAQFLVGTTSGKCFEVLQYAQSVDTLRAGMDEQFPVFEVSTQWTP